MSVNVRNKDTGELVTLASGVRVWIGTKAAHEAAVSAGTMPNNCMVCITDDYDGKGDTVDAVTSGDMHPITSNAVAEKVDEYTQQSYTSSLSGASVQINRIGRICELHFNRNASSTAAMSKVAVATGLPRPLQTIYTVCGNASNNSNDTGFFELSTTGTLYLTTATQGWFCGSFTYITRD